MECFMGLDDKHIRVLHEELTCCYGCPYALQERVGILGRYIFYCVEAWNNDDTKKEVDFELMEEHMTARPPDWCPLSTLEEWKKKYLRVVDMEKGEPKYPRDLDADK